MVDKENQLGREVKARVYVGDLENAKRHLDENKSPLQVISELLRLSNIPIEISVASDSRVIAQKAGGSEYDIAQLSDGERNALLIAAEVLTARPGTLLLIDEPERHLHRSIISPLLTQLFAHRPDCTFVVSTHEVNLPLDHPNVSTLLVRNCSYTGTNITAWEASLVSPGIDIDEEIKRDILGSRSKILFVEGTGQSLDKPLYSLLFPNVSVVAKSSCRDVEQSVTGIRNSTDLHWVQAFGIVDNDRRPQDDLDDLKAKGIYAVPFYSVESIYYHPKIQERIAKRQAATNGTDAAKSLNDAKTAVLSAVKQKVEHLSARVAEKAIREALLKYLPKQKDIAERKVIKVGDIDTGAMVDAERVRLDAAIANENLDELITTYPIRESEALGRIAKSLRFPTRTDYERAVLKLLKDDPEAVQFTRGLFGDLANELDAK